MFESTFFERYYLKYRYVNQLIGCFNHIWFIVVSVVCLLTLYKILGHLAYSRTLNKLKQVLPIIIIIGLNESLEGVLYLNMSINVANIESLKLL